MTSISLEFDPEGGALILRGADAALVRHPLFAAYIRQVRGSVTTDGTILMPTPSEVLAARYHAVAKLLARIGVGLELGENVSDALGQVQNEERRFADFSRRAAEIWNRQIDTEEFRNFVHVVESACPGRTFYRKQLLSAFHLAFSHNACNFSVPGAGKTSVVYAAYTFLKALAANDEKRVDQLLIVGPLSSFKAWEDEYSAIFEREPIVRRISGAMTAADRADNLRGIAFGSRDVEITLTSYQTLTSSEDDFRAFLSRPDRRTMMVLDEAHYIKRADGTWAATALRLAAFAESRVILTGTPAPNGYEDLSNLFKFIYPSRQIVGFPPASLRAMTDGAMSRAVPELKANIRPFYTRIRKIDLNLPQVTEDRVPVGLDDIHERIYRSLERQIVPQLRHDLHALGAPLRVRARLIRLRQASVNPQLLRQPLSQEGFFDVGAADFSVGELEIRELIEGFDAAKDLRRLQVCRDLVSHVVAEQGKVLIWSYFLGNLALLSRSLAGMASFVEVLTGATPVASDDDEEDDDASLATRERIIDRFHTEPGTAILIANPQAVGESISLHKACRTAIYFDRDFNAGRYIQSKDRIHRYYPGGGAPVSYRYLVSLSTVDNDIDARLTMKEQRLSNLVDADDIPLLTASEDDDADDIRAILDAYERRKTL